MFYKKTYHSVFALAFSIMSSLVFAEDAMHPQLKAFPSAENGMQRYVIVLPHKEREEEGAYKIEIIAGKNMLTDGVNQIRLASSIEAVPLTGWGYTYYEVTGKDLIMSTLMATPEGTRQVERFVRGESILISYNSRLPVVIYAPEGYEIRYRIWSTTDRFETVKKG